VRSEEQQAAPSLSQPALTRSVFPGLSFLHTNIYSNGERAELETKVSSSLQRKQALCSWGEGHKFPGKRKRGRGCTYVFQIPMLFSVGVKAN